MRLTQHGIPGTGVLCSASVIGIRLLAPGGDPANADGGPAGWACWSPAVLGPVRSVVSYALGATRLHTYAAPGAAATRDASRDGRGARRRPSEAGECPVGAR
ncbi:hypothetical protein GCM10010221_69410 [Streptomyces parvus]|nr:hypothetical protein GCM10010221_69410 [Streptomyces parvus]